MIGVFEQTLAKTNHWLDALGTTLGTDDREHCYHALKAVLHTLRDRLPVGEAADLGAQLPMLVRGFYPGQARRALPAELRELWALPRM